MPKDTIRPKTSPTSSERRPKEIPFKNMVEVYGTESNSLSKDETANDISARTIYGF